MTIAALAATAFVSFFAGAWWRKRSDADNDAHMSAQIVLLGEAIAEALKPEMD